MVPKTLDLIAHTEAGRIAGVSRVAIWRWRKAGKLKTYVIGSRAFVSRRDVERLAGKRRGGAMSTEDGERTWHGLTVDAPLKDEWLERMNNLRGLHCVHSCAGHEVHSSYKPEWVKDDAAEVAFRMFGRSCEKTAMKYRATLQANGDTRADVHASASQVNRLVRWNGIDRLDLFSQEEIDECPVDHVDLFIRASFPTSPENADRWAGWWEKTLNTLEVLTEKRGKR